MWWYVDSLNIKKISWQHCFVVYLWLDGLLGVIPGIVDVVEVIHSVVVCTTHMVDLQFV